MLFIQSCLYAAGLEAIKHEYQYPINLGSALCKPDIDIAYTNFKIHRNGF